MSIVRAEKDLQLRFNPAAGGVARRGQAGVIIVDDIPAGALVMVRVDRPTELNEAAAANSAPFVFEQAPLPGPFSTNGMTFTRSRQRILASVGNGQLSVSQPAPNWAAMPSAVSGSLVQKGRFETSMRMPGFTAVTPELSPLNRRLLRMRWTGTAAAGESQNARLTDPATGAASTPDGTKRKFDGRLVNVNIVPGSVSMTATIASGTLTLKDQGDGRLVGVLLNGSNAVVAKGDGMIDYVDGTYSLVFGDVSGGAPDNGSTISAGYQHGCLYLPLDLHVEWDALVQ